MSATRGLRRLRARSAAERWLLAEAVLALALARAAVGRIAFRQIARVLKLTQGEAALSVSADQAREAEEIGWALRAAGARVPWRCTCLMQALAASALLRRRGIPQTLCLGAAKDAAADEGIALHAWLRCGETILVGEGGYERFTSLGSFS